MDVDFEAHPAFERDGFDIGTRCQVSFADAALGVKHTVMLPNEKPVEVEWPEGTQPGTVLTVKGQGLPRQGVHWVKPQLAVQVAFMEWTSHGKLRHPRLLGLRQDKAASDVRRDVF